MPIPAGSILPTLADLKAHANITTSTHDTELQQMLDAAVALVARHVGPLDSETVTDEALSGGSSQLVLSRYPVLAITSAFYSDGTAITADDLEVDTASGVVSWGYGTAGRFSAGTRNVRVTYTVGRTSLPAPIWLAILITAADLWSTQMGGGSAVPPYPGAEVDGGVSGNGLPALPPRALSLIEPYLLAPVVA